ncbi:MAG: O-antigen ligase family protein [Candidatus Gracilibacteria bacterium]|nr:O-antigen ligase family protein [Candidatus Gracilibacteria bacterium]
MKKLNVYLKVLFSFFIFLMPFHALLITTLKCRFGIDTNLLRFWKEIFVIVLLGITLLDLYNKKSKISSLLKGNYLVGLTITFIICSLIFIGFPYLEFKVSNFLGFKYDVFFLFCMLIGIYLNFVKENFNLMLKTILISGFASIVIFLPWYLFGDISSLSDIFGYSAKVSTYKANACISFAQNVNGQHRFQGTFGGPITFSIFLVIFYLIYLGYILKEKIINFKLKLVYILVPSLFVILSIFFSYSKTSILGLAFGLSVFFYLAMKYVFKKSLKKSQLYYIYGFLFIVVIGIVIVKRDLFLHPEAILNRLENLSRSLEMFGYNPVGYGLGVAGPASQVGRSIESLGNWQILAQSTSAIAVFLPENWYVQILLEEGIFGFSIFVSLFLVLGFTLFRGVKSKKDFFSIGIFSSFVSICFMALFCHAFEDAGTVYPFFMIIGAYIANNIKINS